MIIVWKLWKKYILETCLKIRHWEFQTLTCMKLMQLYSTCDNHGAIVSLHVRVDRKIKLWIIELVRGWKFFFNVFSLHMFLNENPFISSGTASVPKILKIEMFMKILIYLFIFKLFLMRFKMCLSRKLVYIFFSLLLLLLLKSIHIFQCLKYTKDC